MGRYCSGDIEGKFWFAVQASDDADFFGSEGQVPNYLEYYFDDDGIGSINDGIAKCLEALGDNKSKLDAYFALQEPWNEESVAKATKIPINPL